MTVVSLSWGLRQDCLPALEMYTIVVLAGADTNLEKVGKPAWQKRGHIAVQTLQNENVRLMFPQD